MAKGQKRSNREIKKPKKVKTPVVPPALVSQLTDTKDHPAKHKK